jgi:hypothetical protein
LSKIHPLKDGFGLLNEYGDGNYFISLMFLDLCRCSLKKLDTAESDIHSNVIVNKADPTTFLLNDLNNEEQSLRMCKIVEKKIVIGDITEIDFYPGCFYDRCVYGLKGGNENRRFLDVRILYIFI